jgi:hypothetical protein
MPLFDGNWEANAGDTRAFLARWSAAAAAALNGQLPPGERRFAAEVVARARAEAEAEIARFHEHPPAGEGAGRTFVPFTPPDPTLIAPARFTDRVGVEVIDALEGPRAAAAVLFATEDNKADSDAALAFAARAAALLGTGAGVVIVDALPGPPAWATHLHSLAGVYPLARRPRNGEATVFVAQPKVLEGAGSFAAWLHAVAPGFPLPTVAVPVRGGAYLKLDLEATYLEACERGRA